MNWRPLSCTCPSYLLVRRSDHTMAAFGATHVHVITAALALALQLQLAAAAPVLELRVELHGSDDPAVGDGSAARPFAKRRCA